TRYIIKRRTKFSTSNIRIYKQITMNFLAHLYLSGDDERVKVGNFIGDFVKGKKYMEYPQQIQKGILMHRDIDSFTDRHPLFLNSKHIFEPTYGRYSGVMTDILYDHFLSVHWSMYSKIERVRFINNFHILIWRYSFLIPVSTKKLLPALVFRNWMLRYISLYGIEKVYARMSYRTSLPDYTKKAMIIINDNYKNFEKDFLLFFPEIKDYISKMYGIRYVK
ncbi:MAG: ACP phosphodiesterase, partial [Bacteroidales bacterium]